MPAQSLSRSSAVKVMLHPKVHDDLKRIAETLGQTPSTVASMAVSEYVAQKIATFGMHDRMLEQLTPLIQAQLDADSKAVAKKAKK
jgi:predicted transcriptional regulator